MRSSSRADQIDRALDMLDRIIALIAEEAPGPAPTTPALTQEEAEQLKLRSPAWKDPEIRAAILSLYGEVSAREAADIITARFGPGRGRDKSSVGRIFLAIARAKAGVGADHAGPIGSVLDLA